MKIQLHSTARRQVVTTDPAFLDTLLSASIRLELRSGEETVQDIRAAAGRLSAPQPIRFGAR